MSPIARIQLVAFAAAFDNFLMPPALGGLARTHGATLGEAALVASAYLLAYGLLQLPWGLASDRIGRAGAMRWGLALGALATGAVAIAPSLETAALARLLAGAAMAAAVPACIAWIGDSLPPAERAAAASDMNMAYAAGMAAGTLAGGFLAQFLDWRAAPLLGAAVSAAAFAAAGGLAGAARPPGRAPGLATALASPAMRAVIPFAFLQGVVLFGAITWLAPALLATGTAAGLAGAVAAAYGAAFVAASFPARAWLPRLPPPLAMAGGGAVLAMAWALVAWRLDAAGVLLGACLAAAGAAFLHTSLQVWATMAAPQARGAAVALFAGSLFVGGAVGAQAGGAVVERLGAPALFAGFAALALAHAVAVSAMRARWPGG